MANKQIHVKSKAQRRDLETDAKVALVNAKTQKQKQKNKG